MGGKGRAGRDRRSWNLRSRRISHNPALDRSATEGNCVIAVTATTNPQGAQMFLDSCACGPIEADVYTNLPNKGVVAAYHFLYQTHYRQDVIVYMHDDVEIKAKNWADRVAAEFENPRVAIVGFGGAMGIGVPDIYKIPYGISQLQRVDYYSNQVGWEIHGKREQGSRRVAVVDGFVMAVRVAFLKEVGGWAWIQSVFHCYDTAMCLQALRRGWEVRMVGVPCDHHGGGTSTKAEYIEWLRGRGKTAAQDHQEPHVWQYEHFRDILPVRVSRT